MSDSKPSDLVGAECVACGCPTGAFDGEDVTRIGYVSQFGNVSKQVVMTKTEGTTGMTGENF